MRVGIGYDAHPLAAGRLLVVGGVEIPSERGLAGHSDADVLIHAIIDALLGAASLGNIGERFPETPEYRGASSLELLRRVARLLADNGWKLANIDATVVAEGPRLSGFVDGMRQRIGAALGVEVARVGIKPKSSNGLGFTGKGEGIEAYAVALIEKT
ncbi:MAG: 2-C-methyl-D-erythritol 2,4-cyclodiphosphate synthase [Dehalococcoidia bacterium]|nr:2-C-methyl-D-erythritol 2,4-cyclodiphosphate synthase [Dehalococcoidia bacterium]